MTQSSKTHGLQPSSLVTLDQHQPVPTSHLPIPPTPPALRQPPPLTRVTAVPRKIEVSILDTEAVHRGPCRKAGEALVNWHLNVDLAKTTPKTSTLLGGARALILVLDDLVKIRMLRLSRLDGRRLRILPPFPADLKIGNR